jgi:hypothetical protein
MAAHSKQQVVSFYFITARWPYPVFTQLKLVNEETMVTGSQDLSVPVVVGGNETGPASVVAWYTGVSQMSHTLQISADPRVQAGAGYGIVDRVMYVRRRRFIGSSIISDDNACA